MTFWRSETPKIFQSGSLLHLRPGSASSGVSNGGKPSPWVYISSQSPHRLSSRVPAPSPDPQTWHPGSLTPLFIDFQFKPPLHADWGHNHEPTSWKRLGKRHPKCFHSLLLVSRKDDTIMGLIPEQLSSFQNVNWLDPTPHNWVFFRSFSLKCWALNVKQSLC